MKDALTKHLNKRWLKEGRFDFRSQWKGAVTMVGNS